jgi:hypothetical protein
MVRVRRYVICLVIVSFALAGQVVIAQCDPHWAQGLFSTQGLGGTTYAYVNSLCTYNGELYVGGTFVAAGDINVSYIARWNGSYWQPVGSGVGGYVSAMCVYNGELYVGGHFTSAGGVEANFIARWNGSEWRSVGNGTNGPVLALCVYNGELYAGGVFTVAGDQPALHIARWNGSSWSAVGSGLDGGAFPYVFALCAYNGELYAGGGFQNAGSIPVGYIAKWDGNSWQSVAGGANNFVHALCVFDGKLYAGGDFTFVGGISATRIARWDGTTWQSLGSGMNQSVRVLREYGGELYAGGAFTNAGGIPAGRIAKWNGNTWQALGAGIGGEYPVVYALCDYSDGLGAGKALYVAGYFSSAGGYDSLCIARWGCETPVTTIPQAKLSLDSRLVNLAGVTATASFGSVFYVSEVLHQKQVSGIRVLLPDHNVPPGHHAYITGRVRTNSNGERYIEAWSAEVGDSSVAKPVYLAAKNLGGGSFGFAAQGGQEGVVNGVGLNNIGLLVRLCGEFTYINGETFLINDGSTSLKCVTAPGTDVDPMWQYVVATGVVSCERNAQAIYPVLIVTSVEDISSLRQQ